MLSVILLDDRGAPIADCIAAERAFNPPAGGAGADEAGEGGYIDGVQAATGATQRVPATRSCGFLIWGGVAATPSRDCPETNATVSPLLLAAEVAHHHW
jgi:hypothetical protein